MASRLRSSIGTRISFFSFQDIITSVTGILILVTLILALYLNPSPPVTQAEAHQQQQLQAVLEELGAVSAKVSQTQGRLAEAEASGDPERVRQDVQQLQEQIHSQSNRMSSQAMEQAAKAEASKRKAEELGLGDLMARGEALQQQMDNIKATNATLIQAVARVEEIQRQLQDRIRNVREDHRLWLIPETTPNAKEPVLVVVSRTGITAERFNRPQEKKTFSEPGALAAFTRSFNQWSIERNYLVFYVRPSGIRLFEAGREAAKRAGFTIGYDALEENRPILFSPREETP